MNRPNVVSRTWELRAAVRMVGALAVLGLAAGCAGGGAPVSDSPATTFVTSPVAEPTLAVEPEPAASGETTATPLIRDATWGEREGGRSLAVDPAPEVRLGGPAELDAAWAELIEILPDADSPGMRMQFDCHRLGAPAKDTWNLEPWRPQVSAAEMARARCNP